MNLNITTNLDEVRRRLSGLEKQVNFAASKALNDTAREVRKAIPAGLRRSLDRPTPFTASDGATFVKPGDEIVSGIRAVDAAGHSPGMMAYLIESEGRRLLNWADTCGHYVVSLQRPDIHLDVDDDKEKAAATRQRMLDMAVAEELFVTA